LRKEKEVEHAQKRREEVQLALKGKKDLPSYKNQKDLEALREITDRDR